MVQLFAMFAGYNLKHYFSTEEMSVQYSCSVLLSDLRVRGIDKFEAVEMD